MQVQPTNPILNPVPQLPKMAYSRDEAAYVLSISLRTLDYLIAGGEIPTRKIGARTLVTQADIEKFLKRDHTTKPN